jgi:hypothetical protein
MNGRFTRYRRSTHIPLVERRRRDRREKVLDATPSLVQPTPLEPMRAGGGEPRDEVLAIASHRTLERSNQLGARSGERKGERSGAGKKGNSQDGWSASTSSR